MRLCIAAAAVFAAAPAAADEDLIEQGFGLYQQNCRTCHVMAEGEHRLGPSLHGVVGREVGSVEGFNFSGSLANASEVWDEDLLDAFIENPDAVFSGNQMLYQGMPSEDNRAALIAYIISEGGDGDEEDAEEADAEEADVGNEEVDDDEADAEDEDEDEDEEET
ncbi:hypothetical protein BH23PSE1_BH23PSE1_10940 [soil metagenome]